MSVNSIKNEEIVVPVVPEKAEKAEVKYQGEAVAKAIGDLLKGTPASTSEVVTSAQELLKEMKAVKGLAPFQKEELRTLSDLLGQVVS